MHSMASTAKTSGRVVAAAEPGPLDATPLTTASAELTTAVDDMLKQLQSKFSSISGEMLAKSTRR